MDIQNLCPHCLKEIEDKENASFCPFCGKDMKKFAEVQHQLKPETILEGKYLIGDVIGEGGFGITYVGFDLNLEMRVAIKEFYPNGYATRESKTTSELSIYSGTKEETVKKWRENFIREARNLAKCADLPGIVGVKDFFQANNTAYIILEYVEGKTLKEYAVENDGTLPADQLITQLQPVIEALGEVHKTGIIHRDISPDNLMLMPGGKMKLIDFGAARDFGGEDAKSLSVMLKPGYAPEEQYRSKGKQGPWSDVYALAGTIYKCITGVTPPESVERIQNDELIPLSEFDIKITPQAGKALMKALSVFAEDRYQTMEEFAAALYGEQIEIVAPSQETKTTGKKQENKVQTPEDSEKKKKWIKILAIAGGAVAALVIVLVLALSISKRNEAEEGLETADNTVEEEENLSIGIARVYLEEPNWAPAEKDGQPRFWDRSLFYTLEDIDPSSPADGQVSGYQVTKKQFLNGDSDQLIQFEIYTNPANGQIEKVISVKFENGLADITDYYFQNEKLNFIFHRTDSVYTPTYATPKKPGDRFYFGDDHLIKSRNVWAPLEGTEWVLALEDNPTFPQTLYSNLSAEEQAAFDEAERKWLNEGYNVLATVKEKEGIGTVTGSIIDMAGNPLEGVTVALENNKTEESAFQAISDATGAYTVYVPLLNTESVLVFSKEGYQEQRIYGVCPNEKSLTLVETQVLLPVETDEDSNMKFIFRDAESGSEGTVSGQLSIRPGADNRNGDVQKGDGFTGGIYETTLKPGTYTAEYEGDGYETIFRTFLVKEDAQNEATINCIPKLTDSALRITLEWNGAEETDLDICLFLPEQGADGDMKYVNAASPDSGSGVHLVSDQDGTSGYEELTVDSLESGVYKLYVSDYANAVGGNLTADTMSKVNAVVRVYNVDGQIAEYVMPYQTQGVIWEVFEIQNGDIIPVQRCYSNIEGKTWWSQDKYAQNAWKEAYREFLQRGIVTEEDLLPNAVRSGWSYSLPITFTDYLADHDGWSKFTLYDLTNDDIPELLIAYLYRADVDAGGYLGTNIICTFVENEVRCIELQYTDGTYGNISGTAGYAAELDSETDWNVYLINEIYNKECRMLEMDYLPAFPGLYDPVSNRYYDEYEEESGYRINYVDTDAETFRSELASYINTDNDKTNDQLMQEILTQRNDTIDFSGWGDNDFYTFDQIDEAIDSWGGDK